jgi:hypothetical protein
MNVQKDENGFMSIEQQNNRFINVLQLVYLNSEKTPDGYFVPDDAMKRIEEELDFNTNETSKKKVIEEQRKKFRKRKSYLFWKEILFSGKYSNYNDAKGVLLMIHKQTEMAHQSMTHVRYALETMFLALDDYFQTNKSKITPNRFLIKSAKKKGRKCSQKKKSTKSSPTNVNSHLSVLPF